MEISPASTSNTTSTAQDSSTRFITRFTCACYAIVLILSWRVYFPEARIFARIPAFEIISFLPDTLLGVLYVLQLFCLIGLFIAPSRFIFAYGAVFSFVSSFLLDLIILQPYSLMYSFVLFITAYCRNHPQSLLEALRLMVIGVYFWAGFHKINLTFFVNIFPWFISPFYSFSAGVEAPLTDALVTFVIYATPFFELLIGVLLLFPRFRVLATIMAFTMLVTVLLCLGPLGHHWGYTVWPWNIFLFALEAKLFLKSSGYFAFNRTNLASTLLFILAPGLAILEPGYSYIGFKLYSGNIITAEVILTEEETLQKAPRLSLYRNSAHCIHLINWVGDELHHAPFPTPNSLKRGAAGICPYLDYPDKTQLRIYNAPLFDSITQEYTDISLCR